MKYFMDKFNVIILVHPEPVEGSNHWGGMEMGWTKRNPTLAGKLCFHDY